MAGAVAESGLVKFGAEQHRAPHGHCLGAAVWGAHGGLGDSWWLGGLMVVWGACGSLGGSWHSVESPSQEPPPSVC